MNWKPLFRERELTPFGCICWDPVCVLCTMAVAVLGAVSFLFVPTGTAASAALEHTSNGLLLADIVRGAWLWFQRENYDFSRSLVLYRRFRVGVYLFYIGIAIVMVAAFACRFDEFLDAVFYSVQADL